MNSQQRPIEFRVWHRPDNRMYSVHTIVFKMGIIFPIADEWSSQPLKVEDCVLMQFTGLYDSTGITKVFEGDILYSYCPSQRSSQRSTEYWRLVAYRAGGFCELTSIDDDPGEVELVMLSSYSGSHENSILPDKVVGCYYLNPELLELNTASSEVPESFI